MPKLSPVVSAERRMNIVNAARRCFADRGIAVSVEDICTEAGISKGAFYGYFPSKDAAIEAIAGEHRVAFESLTSIDTVEALAERLYAYAHNGDPRSTRLELEAWTYSLQRPVLRAILQHNMHHMRTALSQNPALSRAADAQVGHEPPPIALVLQIFATGLVATMALGADAQDSTEGCPRDALTYLLQILVGR